MSLKICVRMFLAVFVAASVVSCKDDWFDNSPKKPLEISVSSVLVGKDGGRRSVGVTARDAGWTVTGTTDWCTVDIAAGDKGFTKIILTFTANDATDAAERTTTLVFTSGTNTVNIAVAQLPTDVPIPNQNPDYEDNEAIYELLKRWYYWSEEVGSSPPDPNQSYENFFNRYLEYLNTNERDGKTWAQTNTRYLYSFVKRDAAGTAGLDPLTFGMEFDLREGRYFSASGVVARLVYVDENSPAYDAGLRRGNWFNRVNGMTMGDWKTDTGWWHWNLRIDSLVNPVEGVGRRVGTMVFNNARETLSEGATVAMTPARFASNPILGSQVITFEGDTRPPVGYLAYTRFDEDFSSELSAVFAGFKAAGVSDVILDLRYSRSGSTEAAEAMGNLVAPPAAQGQIFATYKFNDHEEVANFEPDATSGAGVSSVYILTSKFTAGPAELLINALKGLGPEVVRLTVIGEKTEGMNMGHVIRTYSTDEYDYTVGILAFRVENALGTGNYDYGFDPNGFLVDMWSQTEQSGRPTNVTRWKEGWGWIANSETGQPLNPSQQDPMMEAAMDYILGNSTRPIQQVSEVITLKNTPGFQRDFAVQATMTRNVTE